MALKLYMIKSSSIWSDCVGKIVRMLHYKAAKIKSAKISSLTWLVAPPWHEPSSIQYRKPRRYCVRKRWLLLKEIFRASRNQYYKNELWRLLKICEQIRWSAMQEEMSYTRHKCRCVDREFSSQRVENKSLFSLGFCNKIFSFTRH